MRIIGTIALLDLCTTAVQRDLIDPGVLIRIVRNAKGGDEKARREMLKLMPGLAGWIVRDDRHLNIDNIDALVAGNIRLAASNPRIAD